MLATTGRLRGVTRLRSCGWSARRPRSWRVVVIPSTRSRAHWNSPSSMATVPGSVAWGGAFRNSIDLLGYPHWPTVACDDLTLILRLANESNLIAIVPEWLASRVDPPPGLVMLPVHIAAHSYLYVLENSGAGSCRGVSRGPGQAAIRQTEETSWPPPDVPARVGREFEGS